MLKVVKSLRWLIVFFCLTGLIVMTVLVYNSHWVRIQAVQIDLAAHSKEDLLFQRIKLSLTQAFKPYEGSYFWQVPLKSVVELTSKDKRVKKVSVFREFPSRLRVEIEPHTPMLAYLARDGRFYPVATDATLLPALPVSDAPDLPVLRGEELNDEPLLREKALELLQMIPDSGMFAKSHVSEILHTRKDGFKIFISGADTEVQMGDTDFGPKLSRVQKVLAYLDSRNIKGRVIDARFSKKVVVRVRKAP
ncbi:MAG: FtsQ-type POTRA domain-containing protein [Bdellovibrionaceae bacterium]|nr:FtsQ-type POTRA domain-containing protein [Pseudobdellovibrionaceae bacterium]